MFDLNIFMTVIRGLIFVCKLIFKIILFTGILYWLILAFLYDTFLFKRTEIFTKLEQPILFTLFFIIAGYFTVRNVIRLATKNPEFKPIKALILKNQNSVKDSPEAIKNLSTSTPAGFIFGKSTNAYIAKPEDTDGHILIVGGAGSGKSSCLAIPTLLSWQQRIFAIDVKGELYKKTGRRFKNAKVFNPLLQDTSGYDPYYLLKNSRNPVQDAREIALSIIQKTQDIKDPFWIDGAQNLLTGAILFFSNAGLTFIKTIETIQSTPVETLVQTIAGSGTTAAMFVNQFVGMDIKTLSGIFAELSNKIMIFATDPDIKRCLSKSQIITPDDLEAGLDVFICIPEDKLEQWKGLLTLIVNQTMKHCERRPEESAPPVLFLLDEFARLGKVETAISGLATLRSKKITICLIVQSLAQLDAIYGKENRQVIADNCQYKAILNATDADTQEHFSRLVGTYEKLKKSTSANYDPTEFKTTSGSGRTTEDKRIIKPEEFATLKKIVLLTPFGFMQVNKTPYYSDKNFSKWTQD